ncbi:MAG: rhodanese-like domain-containing protein [Tissierellia bacterium]|nr:rhodanese-like domain-containing protein [Tissierellia bacterium]
MKVDIKYPDIFSFEKEKIFVDLRTRREYDKGTIPGAISLPILDEKERKEVSIEYNRGEHNRAKVMAVHFVSEKLPLIFEYINLLQQQKQVVFFCDRGGYRSKILTDIFVHLNIPVKRLKTGYKGYRQYIHHHLNREICKKEYIVLHGLPGAGVEKILQGLKELGEDAIILDQLANYSEGLIHDDKKVQPQQKIFESLFFEQLLGTGPVVFIDGTSPCKGKVHIPKELRSEMEKGYQIDLKRDIDDRIAILEERFQLLEKDQVQRKMDQLKINEKDQVLQLEWWDRGEYHQILKDWIRRNDAHEKKVKNIDWEISSGDHDEILSLLQTKKKELSLKRKLQLEE